jgi:hypothetical protein
MGGFTTRGSTNTAECNLQYFYVIKCCLIIAPVGRSQIIATSN